MALPHRLRPLLAAVVAGVLGLSLLTGCSDEPEPKSSETATTETPSPSETTPAEPEEPERPAALDNGDEAGAKALVRYYFALWDYALDTGDVSTLRTLGASSCRPCTYLGRLLAKSHRNNATVIGGRHTVGTIELTRMQPRHRSDISYLAESDIEASAQTIRDSGIKGLDGKYPKGTSDYIMSLLFSRGRWQIVSLEVR